MSGAVFKTVVTSEGVGWVRFPHIPAIKFKTGKWLGARHWIGITPAGAGSMHSRSDDGYVWPHRRGTHRCELPGSWPTPFAKSSCPPSPGMPEDQRGMPRRNPFLLGITGSARRISSQTAIIERHAASINFHPSPCRMPAVGGDRIRPAEARFCLNRKTRLL